MRPVADAGQAIMVGASPHQHVIPPRAFRRLTVRAGLERGFRVNGFRGDRQIRYRRECEMCLCPVGAG